jgi:hypothetical protein
MIFVGTYCLFVSLVVSFAPSLRSGAIDTTRATNKKYALQKSCYCPIIIIYLRTFIYSGYYGRGVYFSEYPSYSMTYIKGASKLLLCQVLPGKAYRCTNLIHGEPLQTGHDSHSSPDGKELVIFNSRHILPSYVVHYGEAKGDFSYENESL